MRASLCGRLVSDALCCPNAGNGVRVWEEDTFCERFHTFVAAASSLQRSVGFLGPAYKTRDGNTWLRQRLRRPHDRPRRPKSLFSLNKRNRPSPHVNNSIITSMTFEFFVSTILRRKRSDGRTFIKRQLCLHDSFEFRHFFCDYNLIENRQLTNITKSVSKRHR